MHEIPFFILIEIVIVYKQICNGENTSLFADMFISEFVMLLIFCVVTNEYLDFDRKLVLIFRPEQRQLDSKQVKTETTSTQSVISKPRADSNFNQLQ